MVVSARLEVGSGELEEMAGALAQQARVGPVSQTVRRRPGRGVLDRCRRLYLPLLATGLDSEAVQVAFTGLVALNAVSVLLGHRYRAD